MKTAYSKLGSAGGHRSMAKALIPLDKLPTTPEGMPTPEAYAQVEESFLAALRGQE